MSAIKLYQEDLRQASSPHDRKERVVVLGAGATGLATAYLLSRANVDVTVIDAAANAGGLLATFEAGGQQLEYYYHHFFTHDAEIGWLLSELGIEDKIIYRPGTMGMYRKERLYAFDGALDLLRYNAISLPARLRFGVSSLLLSHRKALIDREDLSCLEWFDRWAGREATDSIWRPLLRIKFGDAAEQIPLSWMVGRLRQRARSRKKGGEQLGYLSGSLQVLVDRMVNELQQRNVDLQLATPAEAFIQTGGKVSAVKAGGRLFPADRVVSTLPTPILAKLLEKQLPSYSNQLREIKYSGAICTILSLSESLSPIYWTNVADPGFDFGGVIEHTNLVPPAEYGGQHLVYLSRYVDHADPLWTMDNKELLGRQLEQLERMYKRSIKPLVQQDWIFRAAHAAPLVEMNFSRKIPSFQSPLPGLFLGSMCHVYPDERGVNNSIRIAAELVRSMGFPQHANEVPTGLSMAGTYGHHPQSESLIQSEAA